MTLEEVKAAFQEDYGITLDGPEELVVLGGERERLHTKANALEAHNADLMARLAVAREEAERLRAKTHACEDAMRDALRVAVLPEVRTSARVLVMCEKLRAALRTLEEG